MRSESKCDSIDNNVCEAFNGTIVNARSKPIILMLEDIRVAMMTRVATKRKNVEKWPGNFGPRVMQKLNANIVRCKGWHVDFNGDDGYEIKKGTQQFKVKLQERRCSCRSWDLTGIPCPHACCAIFHKRRHPMEFIDDCYSKETYKKIYSHTIQPMNGELSWPKTNADEILAPKPKTMTGRPKKKRIREPNEPPTGKMSRQGRIMTCSLCKKQGHSKRYCPTTRGQSSISNPSSQQQRSGGGFGIYTNPNTGAVLFNPGQRGQQVIYQGRKNTNGV